MASTPDTDTTDVDLDLIAKLPLPPGLDRRRFLKLAVAAAATTGIAPGVAGTPLGLVAQVRGRGRGGRGQQEQPPPIPLGNGEAPALVFQAYPGGTGALLEKLVDAGAAAADRASAMPAGLGTAGSGVTDSVADPGAADPVTDPGAADPGVAAAEGQGDDDYPDIDFDRATLL